MIFVDDSNSLMPKLKDSERDPRPRIDISKLSERLRGKNRIQGPPSSTSPAHPPNDPVWEAFKKNKFETNIYDRADGGKEKDVENSMLVDMATKATEQRFQAEFRAKHLGDPKAAEKIRKTTFVVITGDRGMMPAVKRVLESNIRVELWGWKSGMSQYLDLAVTNSLLTEYRLDSIF